MGGLALRLGFRILVSFFFPSNRKDLLMPFNQPYLLAGTRASRLRPSTGPLAVAVAVFLLLFGGGAYLLWQSYSQAKQAAQNLAPPVSEPRQLADPVRDDLAIHIQNATRHVQQNIEFVRGAQRRLDLVMSALDRNYLTVEQRRLLGARGLCEDAIWQASAAFEELRIADQQLKTKGEH
jgi:Spy/CpxP family protein refolding chaperone